MFKKLLLSLLAVILIAAPVSANPGGPVTLSKLKNDVTVRNLTTTGTLSVTGATTLTTPLTLASANNAIDSKIINVPIGPGTALANSTAYLAVIAPGRACRITKISIAASTKPAGGTNTVAIEKNGTTTVLNAATFDPTTIAANNTSQALTLTGTTANLNLASTDVVKITWTAGVQTTAAVAPVVSVEVNPTADY